MSNIFATLETLVSRAAGDSLYGLNCDAAQAKVATFTTPRILELVKAEQLKAPTFQLAIEVMREREEQAKRSILQERFDRGDSNASITFPMVGPGQVQLAEHFARANKDQYGLRDTPSAEVTAGSVIEAIHQRCRYLSDELQRRYKVEGEPAGALALRKEISAAIHARWDAERAYDEARKKHRGIGLPETEAAAILAADKANTAAQEVDRLKRQLREEFCIS